MTTEFSESLRKSLFDSAWSDMSESLYRTITVLEKQCESPIEVLLGAALTISFRLFPVPNEDTVCERFWLGLSSDMAVTQIENDVLLVPQFSWENYRIDFCLRIPRLTPKYIFIECDGHDFHERTKEQAAHDRMKDRQIQQAGIPILRFTGSEIFRDAEACVSQVRRFVVARYEQAGLDP